MSTVTRTDIELLVDPLNDPLNSQEAADFLLVSSRCVRNRCERGEIKAIRFGNAWRIPKRFLVDYLLGTLPSNQDN